MMPATVSRDRCTRTDICRCVGLNPRSLARIIAQDAAFPKPLPIGNMIGRQLYDRGQVTRFFEAAGIPCDWTAKDSPKAAADALSADA